MPAIQKTFVNIFSYLPGDLALKKGGDFWCFFCGLRFQGNKARKILEKIRENLENSGENSGRKF